MMILINNVTFKTINNITLTAALCDGDVINSNESSVFGLGHDSQLSAESLRESVSASSKISVPSLIGFKLTRQVRLPGKVCPSVHL